MMNLRIPLSIYVIWHPAFPEGQQIANFIYDSFNRDVSRPLVRTLGIPVYFRSKTFQGQQYPRPIDFNESDFTAIVPLISKEFLNAAEYRKYLDGLFGEVQGDKSKRRIFPVSFHKNAHNVTDQLAAINFINTQAEQSSCISANEALITNLAYVRSCLLHELCRLLLFKKRATEEEDSLNGSAPIKLFISHSKHDDAKLEAAKFRDFISSRTQLKSFFDANDISFGSNFGEQIKNAAIARNSAMVVFQSDSYSDREWCRIEAITAKSAGCPIVVVNAIQNGEKRAFPYLGNVPSIRFKSNFSEIIDLTLEQVLYNLFNRMSLDTLTNIYKLKTEHILTNSPELFDFINLKKAMRKAGENFGVVIYPDPPLGSEEMDVLNQLDDSFYFITPTSLPSIMFNR
jgi:TIR domain